MNHMCHMACSCLPGAAFRYMNTPGKASQELMQALTAVCSMISGLVTSDTRGHDVASCPLLSSLGLSCNLSASPFVSTVKFFSTARSSRTASPSALPWPANPVFSGYAVYYSAPARYFLS